MTEPIEIASLPAASEATLTDYLVTQRIAGAPLKKVTVAQVINTVGAGSTIVAGDVTITSGDAVLDTADITVLNAGTLTFGTGSGALTTLNLGTLTGTTGTLTAAFKAATLTATGAVSAASASVTGLLTAGTITTGGALTAATGTIASISGTSGVFSGNVTVAAVNAGTVVSSGAIAGASATITGLGNFGTVTSGGITGTTLSGTSAALSGGLTAGTITSSGTSSAVVLSGTTVVAGGQTLSDATGPSQFEWMMVNSSGEAAIAADNGVFIFPAARFTGDVTFQAEYSAPNAAITPGVPEHAYDVTRSGAVGDATESWQTCSWGSSDDTIVAFTFEGAVSIASGGTRLTIDYVHDGGVSFSPGIDEGKSIAITGAGAASATLVTTIVRVYGDGDVELADAAGTTLSSSTQQVMWPCFTASSVGQAVWMATTQFRSYWISTTSHIDTTDVYASKPFLAFVDAYVSPFSVTLDRNLPGTATDAIKQIIIGTANAQFVADAGNAAVLEGKTALWYPDGMYFIPAWEAGSSEDPSYTYFQVPDNTVGEENEATAAMKDLQWITGSARGFVCDTGGRPLYQRIIPVGAPDPFPAPRNIWGDKTLIAFAAEDTPDIIKCGDSVGTTDPSNQNAQTEAAAFDRCILQANGRKSLTIKYRSMGGGTLGELACSTNTRGASVDVIYPWHDGSSSWISHILTASPVPDVIDIPQHGINDGAGFHPLHLLSVRTRFLALTTREGHSPDLIWHTSAGTPVAPGVPASAQSTEAMEDLAGFYRGLQGVYGDGLIDFQARAMPAQWGWDVRARPTRRFPNFSHAMTATSPIVFPGRARAWKARVRLIGADGATVWGGAGTLRVILSSRPDNYLEIGVNGSGFLTTRVQSWGRAVATTTSITNGATTLTTSGHSSYTVPLAWNVRRSSVTIGTSGSGPLTSGHDGKCLLFPGTDYGSQPQRTFIEKAINDNTARVDDFGPIKQTNYSATSTVYIGGMLFVEHDATAKTDIIITDGSGNIHKTKIVGFTSRTQVTLQDAWPYSTLSAATATIWVGHTAQDTATTSIDAEGDTGADPFFIFAVSGGHLMARYAVGSSIDDVNDRPVEVPEVINKVVIRGHGPYQPRIECTGSGVTADISNAWMDPEDGMLFRTIGTQRWLRGSPDNYAWGGEASHGAGPLYSAVWLPTCEAQDFAA